MAKCVILSKVVEPKKAQTVSGTPNKHIGNSRVCNKPALIEFDVYHKIYPMPASNPSPDELPHTQEESYMDLMTFGKIVLLLIWPFIFLVILYFYDKEKFMRRLKQQLGIKDK